MKVTIAKFYRDKETLTLYELSTIVANIRIESFKMTCSEIRREYPLTEVKQRLGGSVATESGAARLLPRVCFSAAILNRKKHQQMLAYNGLVLLEVNNLSSFYEAEAVRKSASLIPQTMLAFVGSSGLSVKIVCRGELFEGGLPSSDDDIRRFHVNLYEKARLAYNMQLGVSIEKLEPHLSRSCHISCDPDVVFNEHSVPFYTDCSDVAKAVQPVIAKAGKQETLLPGIDNYHAMQLVYEHCLTKALDDVTGITEEPERRHLLLNSLADYCQESGIPMAIAQRLALFSHRFAGNKNLVQKVFENAYREEHEKQYRRRKGMTEPLKHIPSETLLMMKIDMFLNANYELRKNVMRGVAEYRERTGLGFNFRDLTAEARNSITMKALSQGVKCWDKDISRYVNSNDITLYEPMTDFLDHLPRWDGKDRVEALARRIKTDYEEWPHLFHIWMRSMVAMWRLPNPPAQGAARVLQRPHQLQERERPEPRPDQLRPHQPRRVRQDNPAPADCAEVPRLHLRPQVPPALRQSLFQPPPLCVVHRHHQREYAPDRPQRQPTLHLRQRRGRHRLHLARRVRTALCSVGARSLGAAAPLPPDT